MNQAKYTSSEAVEVCKARFNLSTEAIEFIGETVQDLADELTKGIGYVYDDGRPGLGMGWETYYNTLAVAMGYQVADPNEVDDTWDDVDAVFDTFFRE